jgi:two-component system, sensor histidine kinase and response regulator
LVAGNGEEALALLEQETVDVVLMDVQMPKMDGFEATREIRKRELHTGRHMPIIALTAHVLDSFREECAEAGMDAFLPKPIQFDQLLDVLDQVLNVDRKPEVLASIRR